MRISKISIKNIRSIKDLELNFTNNNLIIGDNAKGKTTIAEVIHYCSFFKSFRTNKTQELITLEHEDAQISLTLIDKGKEHLIEVNFYKNQKKIFLNNKEINNLFEIINFFNVVVITPENIDLINSYPNMRRKYIDMFISQIDKNYLKVLVKYKKILKMKNKILKDYKNTKEIDDMYYQILTEQLDELNDYIVNKRIDVLSNLTIKINEILHFTTNGNESIKINYIPIKNSVNKNKVQIEEYKYYQTVRGNHLDDFEFLLNNKNAKIYASQGQKRLITLSFFIAQNKYIEKEKKINPLIIFDDVHLDLDFKRQKNIIDYLEQFNQTIYITTDIKKMSFLDKNIKKYNIIKME